MIFRHFGCYSNLFLQTQITPVAQQSEAESGMRHPGGQSRCEHIITRERVRMHNTTTTTTNRRLWFHKK